MIRVRTPFLPPNRWVVLLGAGYKDEDLIFAQADGSPWPPSEFSSEFAPLARKHGIVIRFHALRHTNATHLLKAVRTLGTATSSSCVRQGPTLSQAGWARLPIRAGRYHF